ncbi:MAG TPA: signal peptidase I [Acidimicrobiales bacterium]|nr:signal peptidase I [Acidimicrobiales bacterium]
MTATRADRPAAPSLPDTPGQQPRRSRRKRLAEDGAIILLAVAAAILVRAVVAQAYWIPSASMEPQLQINDRVVVSRLAYHLHGVHRGDIVVFKSPPGVEPPPHLPSNPVGRAFRDAGVALGFAQDQTVLIKRVIGLPGDRISASGGHVYVDGELLVEPYLPKGVQTSSFGPVTVPAGRVWVMGDNRGDSLDSRVFGPVPEKSIVGRAVWKVWPPWRPSFL